MQVTPLDDPQQLFHELAAGSDQAFRRIFDLYRNRLQYVALKFLKTPAVAEEVAQDVLMQIWVHRGKFLTIEDPEGYVFTMAYHRIYKQLRRAAKEDKLLDELLHFLRDEQLSVEDTLLAKESRAVIDAAVAGLPPQQQLVFTLSRNEGLSHEEIGRRLGISPHTVKNHIVLALKHIRLHLGRTAMVLATMFWNHHPPS